MANAVRSAPPAIGRGAPAIAVGASRTAPGLKLVHSQDREAQEGSRTDPRTDRRLGLIVCAGSAVAFWGPVLALSLAWWG